MYSLESLSTTSQFVWLLSFRFLQAASSSDQKGAAPSAPPTLDQLIEQKKFKELVAQCENKELEVRLLVFVFALIRRVQEAGMVPKNPDATAGLYCVHLAGQLLQGNKYVQSIAMCLLRLHAVVCCVQGQCAVFVEANSE